MVLTRSKTWIASKANREIIVNIFKKLFTFCEWCAIITLEKVPSARGAFAPPPWGGLLLPLVLG
jgi:hypothetical protein